MKKYLNRFLVFNSAFSHTLDMRIHLLNGENVPTFKVHIHTSLTVKIILNAYSCFSFHISFYSYKFYYCSIKNNNNNKKNPKNCLVCFYSLLNQSLFFLSYFFPIYISLRKSTKTCTNIHKKKSAFYLLHYKYIEES